MIRISGSIKFRAAKITLGSVKRDAVLPSLPFIKEAEMVPGVSHTLIDTNGFLVTMVRLIEGDVPIR